MNARRFASIPAAAFAIALVVTLAGTAQENKENEKERKSPPRSNSKSTSSKGAPNQQRPGGPPSQPPARANEPARNYEGSRGTTPGSEAPGRTNGAVPPARANYVGGRQVPANARVIPTRGGGTVAMRPDGRPAVVHTAAGVDIQHGMNGRTVVVREGADHSRVFVERGGFGYVQHPYVYAGHPYVARTYFVGGRSYQAFYRGYPYHGVYLEVYAPVRYYPVGFYGYVAAPWAAPVVFSWGWGARPWYGYYGWYFRPYPVYASPALWLTDYLIAESLAASYDAQVAASQPPPPPPPGQAVLTPEVKQAIADEVRNQIALENQEARGNLQNTDIDPATSGIAAMFSDNRPHVFVVGDSLDLMTPAGQQCAVSEGDVLQLAGPPPPDSPAATLVVLASKGGVECRQASSVSVGLADLQNMQDHMRQTLDRGLADLQAHQNGLPAPPQQALATATPAVYSTSAPPPDPTVQQQLNQQYQQGSQAEQQTLAEANVPAIGSGLSPAPAPSGNPGTPGTITLGQSIDQVTSILGQPKNVVDLGTKKIYVYPDLKVTFIDGKVSDVE